VHVGRAELENVDVALRHLTLRRVDHFADGEEAELVGGVAHQLEARFTHTLEGVRRGARLEGTAAQDFCACFGDTFRYGKDLFARFDPVRSRVNGHLRAASRYISP